MKNLEKILFIFKEKEIQNISQVYPKKKKINKTTITILYNIQYIDTYVYINI